MGRLRNWIDRLDPARRRGVERSARRRPLMFELCESRLALSAATRGDVSEDVNALTTADLLVRLWDRTPGSADWAQVSFGQVWRATRIGDSLQFDVGGQPYQILGVSTGLAEGGLINFDVSQAVPRGNSSGWLYSSAVVDAAFDFAGLGPTFSGQGEPTPGGELLGPAIPDHHASAGGLDATGGWNDESVDYTDLLGESEVGSPTPGGAINDGPPVLRIAVPLAPAGNEGGTIDLTAMAGPTRLFADASTTTLAAQTPNSQASPVAVRFETTDASTSLENLRARAVVYEVSYELDAQEAAASGRLDSAARGGKAAVDRPGAATKSDAAQPHVAEATDRLPNQATTTPTESNLGESAQTETPAPADNESAAATVRDAALAAWGDPAADDISNADAGLVLADGRHHHLGLAVALAVGAAPLARRARRSRRTAAEERNAGLP